MTKREIVLRKAFVFSTYFAQGLPYSLIAVIPTVMFRDLGADLSTIGFLSLLNIPWVIKFLWAPFVDSNSTFRKWIYSTELLLTLAVSMIALSLFSEGLAIVTVLLLLGAVMSATHDIAVDGYYMTSLDEISQKKEIGFRVLAYRLALAFGSGVIISIGTIFSWRCAFGTAAFSMLMIYLIHKFFLPEPLNTKPSTPNSFLNFKKAFSTFFKRENIVHIVMFIVFLRAGEYLLGLMRGPFMVDLGIKVHIGWISGGIAIPATILGAISGGYLISKKGVDQTAVPIIIFQNLTNLLYAALGFYFADKIITDNFGIAAVALVNGIESFSSGMGTALLMIFLINLCAKEFKAAHYAIGSGLMALSGALLNSFGGIVAESTGYGWFFVISFLAAMPALLFFRKELM
ncbi:MAG TPA: MFS transporter [bacterium]|nr:MFS transporter [bacterium]HPV22225.1 MFS transporter [bacterium]